MMHDTKEQAEKQCSNEGNIDNTEKWNNHENISNLNNNIDTIS